MFVLFLICALGANGYAKDSTSMSRQMSGGFKAAAPKSALALKPQKPIDVRAELDSIRKSVVSVSSGESTLERIKRLTVNKEAAVV